MKEPRPAIGQLRAFLSGLAIVTYFTVATVWLPSALLRSPLLAGADRDISDLVAVVAWGVGLGFGMWALRRAQDRALI